MDVARKYHLAGIMKLDGEDFKFVGEAITVHDFGESVYANE